MMCIFYLNVIILLSLIATEGKRLAVSATNSGNTGPVDILRG